MQNFINGVVFYFLVVGSWFFYYEFSLTHDNWFLVFGGCSVILSLLVLVNLLQNLKNAKYNKADDETKMSEVPINPIENDSVFTVYEHETNNSNLEKPVKSKKRSKKSIKGTKSINGVSIKANQSTIKVICDINKKEYKSLVNRKFFKYGVGKKAFEKMFNDLNESIELEVSRSDMVALLQLWQQVVTPFVNKHNKNKINREYETFVQTPAELSFLSKEIRFIFKPHDTELIPYLNFLILSTPTLSNEADRANRNISILKQFVRLRLLTARVMIVILAQLIMLNNKNNKVVKQLTDVIKKAAVLITLFDQVYSAKDANKQAIYKLTPTKAGNRINDDYTVLSNWWYSFYKTVNLGDIFATKHTYKSFIVEIVKQIINNDATNLSYVIETLKRR